MKCANCHAKVPDNITQCPYCDCGFTFQKQIDKTDKYGNKIQLLRIEREKLLNLKKTGVEKTNVKPELHYVETKQPIGWISTLAFFIIALGMPILSVKMYHEFSSGIASTITTLVCVIALILIAVKKDKLFTKTVKIPVEINPPETKLNFEIKDGYFYTKDVIGYYNDDDISAERVWVEIDKKECKTVIKDSMVHGYKIYIEDVNDDTDALEALYFPDIFNDSEIIQLINSLMPIKFINFDNLN